MAKLMVEVWRGGLVESSHAVCVAVDDGRTRLQTFGRVQAITYMRSAAKPFQALAAVECGLLEKFGLTSEELAVMCASHNGEQIHVNAVRGLLQRAGLDESDLALGAHWPRDRVAAAALRAASAEPRPIHNNCSGKHAGMLSFARLLGAPTSGYLEPQHPVQRAIRGVLGEMAGVAPTELVVAIDGCGAPVWGLPVAAMARAYAHLVAPSAAGSARSDACQRVVQAMTAHPYLVAGSNRICTDLMTVTGGRILAKVGAEGVYCVGDRATGSGLALKVEDGADRAVAPSLLFVLSSLGLLSDAEQSSLEVWAHPILRNTQGRLVGDLRVRVEGGEV